MARFSVDLRLGLLSQLPFRLLCNHQLCRFELQVRWIGQRIAILAETSEKCKKVAHSKRVHCTTEKMGKSPKDDGWIETMGNRLCDARDGIFRERTGKRCGADVDKR